VPFKPDFLHGPVPNSLCLYIPESIESQGGEREGGKKGERGKSTLARFPRINGLRASDLIRGGIERGGKGICVKANLPGR